MGEISRAALFGKLNSVAYKAIEAATVFCKLRGNPYVELVHWLHQILQLQDSDLHRIIRQFSLEPARLARDLTDALDRLPRGSTSITDLSSHVEEAVERGWVYGSLMFGESQVRTAYLVVGMLKTPSLRHALSAISSEFDKIKVESLIERFAFELADPATGLICEHYDLDWQPDWEYQKGRRDDIFKPWGYQTGHQTEWAKLLLILHGHLREAGRDEAWLVPRAQELFDRSMEASWDGEYGGLVYGFAPESLRKDIAGPSLPDGRHFICDDDKYFWVQAESLATAAVLAQRTGDAVYWEWYDRLWAYAWEHFVDHRYGAWFRILDRRNRKYDEDKSPAGKTDYHTMGACHDVLSVLRAHD